MAYFNFNLARKHNLNPRDVVYLQLIKQNKFEDNSFLISQLDELLLNNYEKEGFVEYIKGNKSDTRYQKIRLTKKGSSLLDALELPNVEEDDIKLLNWLSNIYFKEDKSIGNRKRILLGIAGFRTNTGITKNNFALLLKTFIQDEKNFEYSHKLEYLFFNPKNLFQRKFSLDDCRLYEYYLVNKHIIDNNFK